MKSTPAIVITPGWFYAAVTVLAWGSWLAPSQNVKLRGQQTRTFYVTLAVFLMASVGYVAQGSPHFTSGQFVLPFLGGLLWAVSCWSAFVGAARLGMARAFGIWAPLNIFVSIGWGMVLFSEFLRSGPTQVLLAAAAVLVMIGGILLIILPTEAPQGQDGPKSEGRILGYIGAIGAGIGFATYFIPVRVSQLSMWTAMFPLACGMLVGAIVLAAASRSSLRLETRRDYALILLTGLLWGIGNYAALAMMERVGTGKGFTIAQLCVVVNALIGVYVFKVPKPGTRVATLTLAGVVLAAIGGAILGGVKN